MRLKSGIARLCVAALLATPSLAVATNGFFQIGIGPKTRGMAGAGIAYAQDSWSVATNPAGMVHVGCRFDAGVPWVKQKATATFSIPLIVQQQAEQSETIKSDEDLWWPQLAINYMLSCDQSVGLAAYVAGQSRVHWDHRWTLISPLNFDGDPGRLDFLHIFVVPSWAWQ